MGNRQSRICTCDTDPRKCMMSCGKHKCTCHRNPDTCTFITVDTSRKPSYKISENDFHLCTCDQNPEKCRLEENRQMRAFHKCICLTVIDVQKCRAPAGHKCTCSRNSWSCRCLHRCECDHNPLTCKSNNCICSCLQNPETCRATMRIKVNGGHNCCCQKFGSDKCKNESVHLCSCNLNRMQCKSHPLDVVDNPQMGIPIICK